jgi:glycosyltransferase involved in cell wall biosynthesis
MFILEQLRALAGWMPILVGYRRIPGGIKPDEIKVSLLPGLTGGRWQRWRLKISQLFGVEHPPTTRALRCLAPDLIHVHFGLDAVDLWPSVHRLGVPMLVTLHGFDINIHRSWWEAGHGGLRRRTYPKRLLRLASNPTVHFIAVSRAIRKRAIDYGIPKQKITVAYIGVDTRRFRPGGLPLNQRRRRILFVGRMVEKKAPLLMIRAFEGVRKQVPDAELVMIGEGPLLGKAKALAKELLVSTEFLGALTSDEVLAQLHEARILCLPSVTASNGDAEGFGLVILEAQACGVPVVTSATGGAKEGIQVGKTGVNFHEGDQTALIEGLKNLLLDDAYIMQASTEATRFARETFDIRKCTRSLECVYDHLTE